MNRRTLLKSILGLCALPVVGVKGLLAESTSIRKLSPGVVVDVPKEFDYGAFRRRTLGHINCRCIMIYRGYGIPVDQ